MQVMMHPSGERRNQRFHKNTSFQLFELNYEINNAHLSRKAERFDLSIVLMALVFLFLSLSCNSRYHKFWV